MKKTALVIATVAVPCIIYTLVISGMISASGSPIQTTDFLTYNSTTGKVEFKYDLNDSQHYWEIAPPPIEDCTLGGMEWACQSGDPTILHYPVDGQYYVIYREKTPTVTDVRMKRIICITSDNLVNWSTVWNYHKDDFQQCELDSIERSSLRYYNDRLYLYFTYDFKNKDWNNAYVVGEDFKHLGWNLTNCSMWHNITYPGIPLSTNPGKHTGTYFWNGSYYESKNRGYSLMESANAEGPWVNFSDPVQLCFNNDSYDNCEVDTITYDPYSKLYIAWGHSKLTPGTTTKYFWWWATSPDLENWTWRGRQLQKVKTPLPPGQRRYSELSVRDVGVDPEQMRQRIVLVMQWDHNDDIYDSIILWHFPAPTPTPSLPGDADENGIISAGDITKVERIILGWDAEIPNADANQDGMVNTTDIGVIEYMILQLWPWNHVHIEAPDNLSHCTNFIADVFVTCVEDFSSTSLLVTYNAGVLDLVSVTNGSMMEVAPGSISAKFYPVGITDWSMSGGPGAVRINASVAGGIGVNASGFLARLHFHVNGSAGQVSPIALNESQSRLKDNVGGDINATWEDDSLTVAP